jgi:hypothetical protein
MANIEINEALWNSVSEADKAQITASLKKNRLLMGGDSITANPGIPQEGFLDNFNPGKEFCRIGCDAAAAAAIASLTLAGPALAVALVVIAAAREACRDSC